MAESDSRQCDQFAHGAVILVHGKRCIVDTVTKVHDDGRVTWLDTEGRTHTSTWIAGG